MSDHTEFKQAVEVIRKAADPVMAMRDLVLAQGGHWADANEDALFEINFLGIAGTGFGATSAVASWIKNVEQINAVDTAA